MRMRVTKITKNGFYPLRVDTEYDVVLELAVSSYDLDVRSKKEKRVDNKHYLIEWWTGNIEKFQKYKTLSSIASLLKVHHASINHLQKHRVPSLRFDENVECIKDFLNS